MTVETLGAIISFLLIVGGIGWRLSGLLGEIKGTLATFIATSTIKFDAMEKRIDGLESRVNKLEDSQVEIRLSHPKGHS